MSSQQMSTQATTQQDLRKIVTRSIEKLNELLNTVNSGNLTSVNEAAQAYTQAFLNFESQNVPANFLESFKEFLSKSS